MRPVAGICLSAALASGPAHAFDAAETGEIETIIRDYLIRNPDVLVEALDALEAKRADEARAAQDAALASAGAELTASPAGTVLGNPEGDVTLVEFFDYNCGYCKRAMADMLDLMKTDPKLKVVLKEFPVLGPGSVEAAQVAVAARMQDPGGKKYLDFHQKLLGGRGQ